MSIRVICKEYFADKKPSLHPSGISKMSWSALGSRIACLSKECISVLDLRNEDFLKVIPAEETNWWTKAQFNPTNLNELLVSKKNGVPFFIDLSSSNPVLMALDDNITPNGSDIYAVYDFDGNHIIIGESTGNFSILSRASKTIVFRWETPSPFVYKDLFMSYKGSYVLANCSDRILRGFAIDKAKSVIDVSKFSDIVSKSAWNVALITPDGNFVIAGTGTKDMHNIYFWDIERNQFISFLEGPKESLVDMSMHPFRSQLITVSVMGDFYIWTRPIHDIPSAFAPDFTEIEENIEYEERECEFDLIPESELTARKKKTEDDTILDFSKPMYPDRPEETVLLADTANEIPLKYLPLPQIQKKTIHNETNSIIIIKGEEDT